MKSIHLDGRPERLRRGVLASAIFSALTAGYSSPAMTQESAEEIVVTGSRIVRRDFEANSPIMTVDEELFENTSTIGVETVMNQLPQFVPAVTQFDSGEIQSTATNTPGASTLSLRGLGSNRNLVLLNGRRAMPVNASGAVDINMIPSSAIQRVETITGGASSVYGADAMAGVVNFILKDNYQGFELDMQYGITEEGDGEQERLNGLWGANFNEGQGNVLLGFEYSRRGEVMRADRDFYQRGWADPTVNGTATRISEAQWGVNSQPSQAAVDRVFSETAPGTVSPAGPFSFNDDGSIYSTSEGGAYRYQGPFNDHLGTIRKFTDEGALVENQTDALISIPMERYAVFGRAHMDISENTAAFLQANFAQNSNRTTLQYSPATGPWGAQIPYGNEIWEDSLNADGSTASAYRPGGLHGLNCGPMGGCTETEAFPVPDELAILLDSREDPSAAWLLGDVLDWAGPRRTENKVTSFQLVFGFDGRLPFQDWTWETYASYGNTNIGTKLLGFASVERFRAVASSPNYGRGFFFTGNPEGDGFGGGLGQCATGLPIFERFIPTEDCQEAITANLQNQADMEQKVFEANLQGGIMELPAGQLRFAAGVSYRENNFDYLTDVMVSQNSFLDSGAGLFPASNTDGSTKSRDVYGELLIPVVAGLPLVQEFNIEAGYRYSNNDPSPNVDTYKVLLDWTVNDRIRFRGGYQVANRAPNIGELFLSRTQTLAFTFDGDYCSTRNPSNPFSANPELNPNAAEVQQLCRTLMGSTGAANFYSDPENQPDTSAGFSFINLVGNAELDNETADTMTLGGVFNITDGLTLTADWYNIEISDMISAQTASSVYRQCLDPSINAGFDPNYEPCQRLVRNPSTGLVEPTDVSYSNEAWLETSGIDFNLRWNQSLFNGSLTANIQATYLDEMKTRVTPAADVTEWVGTAGPNDVTGVQGGAYDYRAFTTVTYIDNAGWNLTLRWRHLPGIDNAGTATGTSTVLPTNDYNIFDFSGGYRWGSERSYLLRYGVDNLFDTQPQITGRNANPADLSTGAGSTDSSFYDVLGRRYYVGFQVQF